MKKSRVEYHYRGQIERGNGKGGYVWRDGYSETSAEGYVSYPWNTYRECQRAAKSEGKTAVFFRDGKRVGSK